MQTLQLKIAQNSVAYVRLAANGNDPDSTVRLGWIGLRFGLYALRFGLGIVWFEYSLVLGWIRWPDGSAGHICFSVN